jgi:hypothetical protein
MTKSKRAAVFANVAHYMAAFTILMKGLDKIENPEKTGIAILFLAIGTFIILGTIFHHKAEKLLHHFTLYVYLLECLVLAIVGYLYMKEGKLYLPYICYAASAMFFVAAAIYFFKHKNRSHQSAH